MGQFAPRGLWLNQSPDSDTVVVFVNAAGTSPSIASEFAQSCSLVGADFMTWRLRDDIDIDEGIQQHIEDGATTISNISPRKNILLVGWCTGAVIASAISGKLPEIPHKLVLLNGAFMFNGNPGGRLGNAMLAMCRDIVNNPEKAEYYFDLTKPNGNEKAVLKIEQFEWLLEHLLEPYANSPEWLYNYAKNITAICSLEPEEYLNRIKSPTYILAGKNDLMVDFSRSVQANSVLATASLHIYDNEDHYFPFTRQNFGNELLALTGANI